MMGKPEAKVLFPELSAGDLTKFNSVTMGVKLSTCDITDIDTIKIGRQASY